MDADYIELVIEEELEKMNVNLSDSDSEYYTDTEENFTKTDEKISIPDSVLTYVDASNNRLNTFEQLILEDVDDDENGATCTESNRVLICDDPNELTSTSGEDSTKLKEVILSEFEEQAAGLSEVDQTCSDKSTAHTNDDQTECDSYKECERQFIFKWRELEERLRKEEEQRIAQLEVEKERNLSSVREQEEERRRRHEELRRMEKVSLFGNIKASEEDCETNEGLSLELIKQKELIERLEEQLLEERHMFEKAQQEDKRRTMEQHSRAATTLQAALRGSWARRWCRGELVKRREEERMEQEERGRRREREERLKRELEEEIKRVVEEEQRRREEVEMRRAEYERAKERERHRLEKQVEEQRQKEEEQTKTENERKSKDEQEKRRMEEERADEERREVQKEVKKRKEKRRQEEEKKVVEVQIKRANESEPMREVERRKQEKRERSKGEKGEEIKSNEEKDGQTSQGKSQKEETRISITNITEEHEKGANELIEQRGSPKTSHGDRKKNLDMLEEERKGEFVSQPCLPEISKRSPLTHPSPSSSGYQKHNISSADLTASTHNITTARGDLHRTCLENKVVGGISEMDTRGPQCATVEVFDSNVKKPNSCCLPDISEQKNKVEGGISEMDTRGPQCATVEVFDPSVKEPNSCCLPDITEQKNKVEGGISEMDTRGPQCATVEVFDPSVKEPNSCCLPDITEQKNKVEGGISEMDTRGPQCATVEVFDPSVKEPNSCCLPDITEQKYKVEGGISEMDTRGPQCATVEVFNPSVKEPTSCCLPDITEQKRLAWMLSCTPWSKLSMQNRRKRPSAPARRRAPRRASRSSLPPLPLDTVLKCGPWSSLNQVTTVTLEDLPGCSLSTLSECSRLQSLTLRRCGLQALDGLHHCGELKHVDVQDNSIAYVDCAGLARLEVLLLGRNQLTNVHGMEGATNLTVLQLSYNAISRLGGLGSLKKLQRLSVDHNQLISTRGLGDIVTLLYLDCSYNHLSRAEGLENCALLNTLDLRGNSLTELPELSNHVLLRELYADENSVSCVQGLGFSWLPLLRCLSLGHNSITQLPLLMDLLSLKTLDVSHNCLSELRGVCQSLQGCSSLLELNLTDNPLLQESTWRSSVLAIKPNLIQLNGELTGASAVPSVGSAQMYSFQAICQAHQDQLDSVLQKQSMAISSAPSTLDAQLMVGDHSAALFQLAEEQRYAHEYGDGSVCEPACNEPAVLGCLQACADTEQNPGTLTQRTVEPHTQISSEPHAQRTAEPHTQNSAVPHTQRTSQPHTQNSAETHTLRASQPHTQNSVEPHTQNQAEPHIQNSAEPHTLRASQPHTQNSVEPHTLKTSQPHIHNSAEPHTQNQAEPHIQNSAEPHTQSPTETHTQSLLEPSLSGSALNTHPSSADQPAVFAGGSMNQSQRLGESRKGSTCADEHSRAQQLKTMAATVIQCWWRTCRQRRHMGLNPLMIVWASKKRSEPFNKHGAAAVIQAVWRGYSLRRRLSQALTLVRSTPLDCDILEEVDMAEFIYAEDVMERDQMALHSEVSLGRALPYLGRLLMSKPSPSYGAELHMSASVLPWKPREAWAGNKSVTQRSESPDPNPRYMSPAPTPRLTALSERSEKIFEEWGISSSSTALLMLKRAQRMKARKQQQRKLLAHAGVSVPAVLAGEVGEQSQHRPFRKLHPPVLESQWSSYASERDHFLPEINAEVLNGGRVQLVASAGYRVPDSVVRLRGGAAGSPPPCSQHPPTQTHSQAQAAKEAVSPRRSISALPRTERISFRDNPVRMSGGWGGGKKRAKVNN